MRPRIVTRTHYQVDEPAYLRVLIAECSSPTKSDYQDRVASRLEQRIRTLGPNLNLAAAKYCVDLAKALHLLTDNLFWTWSAHVLRLVGGSEQQENAINLNLSMEERIFWFRTFLEFDGAALLFLAHEIVKFGQLPRHGSDWNDVANDMVKYVYTSYLSVMQDIRDRAEVRHLLAKREREPYKGKSGSHQCFVHLNTMARMGLLAASGREYRRPPDVGGHVDPLSRFAAEIPDVSSLEAAISKKMWPSIANYIFNGTTAELVPWRDREILAEAREIYDRVIATGVTLCSLDTIIETIQIRQIARAIISIPHEECMTIFRREQAKNPKEIKFHVDRIGRPTFIQFS